MYVVSTGCVMMQYSTLQSHGLLQCGEFDCHLPLLVSLSTKLDQHYYLPYFVSSSKSCNVYVAKLRTPALQHIKLCT